MPMLNKIYSVGKTLGAGGFGTVFLAEEEISERRVAIKKLNNTDARQQDNIIHEIQVVSKFNHPNIVTYYHHFTQDGLLYLVMEFCSGGSLREILRTRQVGATEAIDWVLCMADTLEFVHDKGIVHHDIKPENIMLSGSGTLKLSDFGVANSMCGTRAYMSPESFSTEGDTSCDPRVDIYALGVMLMELLTGKNVFYFRTPEEIWDIHQRSDFSIQSLPVWQQEIILKAINRVPELRFQTMRDLASALRSQHVPVLLDKDAIRAAKAAERAERALTGKRWYKAGGMLEFVALKYPNNVNVLRALGKNYLLQQKPHEAKIHYEQALKLNPRLDVQKDLGWIYLGLKKYPSAISLLSDHLHRNPFDLESHNLLIQCYYEIGRYDVALSLAATILEVEPQHPCFTNNLYIAWQLCYPGGNIEPSKLLGKYTNAFIEYNHSVVSEEQLSHSWKNHPTLQSKLLFMDYRFRKLSFGCLYFSRDLKHPAKVQETRMPIITIGRSGYSANNIKVARGTAVSRRHCLVVNAKDDAWLYDLDSTGTSVNGVPVTNKVPLVGRSVLEVAGDEFMFATEKDLLI